MAVTLKYPFVKIEAPPEYRGVPHINPRLCIGCGACVNACPADALLRIDDYEKGTRKIVLDVGRCIRCARCDEACPTGAIRMTRNFEVATLDRKDHVEVVELRLHRCPNCGSYTDYTERALEKALQILPEGLFDEDEIRKRAILCRNCRRKLTVDDAVEASREVVE